MTTPNTEPTPAAAPAVPAAPAPAEPTAVPAEPPAAPAPVAAAPGQQPLPAVDPNPPGTPEPPAPQPAATPKGKSGQWLRLPKASFAARVKRDAESMVQSQFGVTFDEAKRLVDVGRNAEKGLLDNKAATDTTVKQLQEELDSTKRRLVKANEALQAGQKKHKREVKRLKDRQIEAQLKHQAARSGIKDTDYAVHLFAQAINSGDERAKDPSTYFNALRESHSYLFEGTTAPPPVEVTPSTAPPASAQPGEVTPEPADPGAAPPAPNVEDLDNQEFSRHTQSKYGFTPGMG